MFKDFFMCVCKFLEQTKWPEFLIKFIIKRYENKKLFYLNEKRL